MHVELHLRGPAIHQWPTHLKGRIEVVNGPIKTYVDVTIP
jgi:hypothetical protein